MEIMYYFNKSWINIYIFLFYNFLIFLQRTEGSDPDHCIPRNIKCYECSSESYPGCGDPFIAKEIKHDKVRIAQCTDYCFKWKLNMNGVMGIKRGCGSNLTMSMEKYLVCISESSPKKGRLCFCNNDVCNHAVRNVNMKPAFLILVSVLVATSLIFVH